MLDQLSPAVKRYAVIAAVLLVALLAVRTCSSGPAGGGGKPTPRGLRTQ